MKRSTFLADGGEMGRLMRAHDWSASPLDDPETWPQPLKTLVGVMLGSNQAMFIAWGAQRTMLYNERYAELLQDRHPAALGQPFAEVWWDIMDDVGPILDRAFAGEATHMDDIAFILTREGRAQEAHFAFSYTPVRDEAGAVAGMFCACSETTGQVFAERRIAAERDRQRKLFEQAPGFITILSGPELRFEFVNDAYDGLFGRRGFVGKTVREAFPDLEGQPFFDLLDNAYATGERFVARTIPIRLQATPEADPADHFLDFIYEPVRDEAGAVTGLFIEGHDVTERVKAEQALTDAERRLSAAVDAAGLSADFRALFEASPTPFLVVAPPDWTIVAANDARIKVAGFSREAQIGRRLFDLFPDDPDDPTADGTKNLTASFERVIATGTGDAMAVQRYAVQGPDGRYVERWWSPVNSPVLDRNGAVSLIIHRVEDVTETVRLRGEAAASDQLARDQQAVIDRLHASEAALRESEARYRTLFEAIDAGFCIFDMIFDEGGRAIDFHFVEVNPAFERQTGIAGAVGQRMREIAPDLEEVWFDRYGHVAMTGEPLRVEDEAAALGRWFDINAFRVGAPEQRRVAALLNDMTARRKVEAELRTSEEFNRRVLASSADCVKVLDLDGRLEFMSEGGKLVMEVDDFSAINGTYWPDFWLGETHEEALAAVAEAKRGGTGRFQGFATTMKGTPRWWDVAVTPINGADGNPERLLSISRDVTIARNAEERLRDLNADLERQVAERTRERGRTWEVSPDLLCVFESDGRFSAVNPAWTARLGWTQDELVGALYNELLHPEDAEPTAEMLGALQRDLPVLGHANRYRTKDGGFRWLSWVAVPVDGKFYCSARDVTADKEQAALLAERTAERDRMWETSPDLMLVIDIAGVFRRVNPAWKMVLGYEPDELVDHHVNEFVLPEDHAETVNAYELAAAGGLPVVTNRYRHKDGSVRWISWSAAPADDRMTYATGRDITADKQRSVELDAAQEALRQSQKLEAIGQLTGGVAHDFNNLLTVIRGSADLLRRGNLTEEKRARYIDAIGDTADRAAKLTGQLLAFARRQSLSADLFDVGASLSDVATMLRTMTGSRIVLDLQLPSEPYFIVADRSQFDTAIVNMGINARDAMSGEGRLTISTGPVSGIPEIRSHPAIPGDFIAVTIADNGTGISRDQLANIFEPFFTTKGVGQGTGLGLSQVFGFAKQSGGDIRVDSTPGEGTTFTLYLPRATDEAAPTAASVQVEIVGGGGRCVLVVEDNEDVGIFATAALRDLGYETVFAADAQAALAVLATEGHRFNAVFSDVVMPGMSGIELAQEVRRLRPDLPVILTSGYSHVLAQNGRHGFELLHKPYSIEQLSRVLRKAVSWNAERIAQA